MADSESALIRRSVLSTLRSIPIAPIDIACYTLNLYLML